MSFPGNGSNGKRLIVAVLGITLLQGIAYPQLALADETLGTSVPEYVSNDAQQEYGNVSEDAVDGAEADVSAGSEGQSVVDDKTTSQDSVDAGEPGESREDEDIEPQDPAEPQPDGWQYDENGQKTHWIQDGRPVTSTLITDPTDGEKYWLEADGTLARSKQIYDPASDAWYWVDADGTVAVDKDVYIPEQGKWVRYDSQGRMIKGEDCRYGGWYYFDPITGAMAKGEKYLNFDARHTGWYHYDEVTGVMDHGFVYLRNNNKWVYYDQYTGIMQYGEHCIDGGWYYLTPGTGAVDYDWAWIPGKNKWVYYDSITGRMIYGDVIIDNKPYYLDMVTGARWSKSQIVNKLVATARSYYNQHPDCPGVLAANGGLLCPFGPCMSYVWYVFHQADLDAFLCNGAKTGWPHHNYDWYRSRGRVDMNAQVGDLAFYKFPESDWARNYSSSHAAIVVRVDRGGVWVADAINNGIGEHYSYSCIQGFAHPYYD